MQQPLLSQKLFTAAFVAETLCVTYALLFTEMASVTSLVYFFSGLIIAFAMVLLPESQLSFSIKK